MICGTLNAWKNGGWYVRDDAKQLNHYLTDQSTLEVEFKGRWLPVHWVKGPGGCYPYVEDDRPVPEKTPAKLFESHDNVRDIGFGRKPGGGAA